MRIMLNLMHACKKGPLIAMPTKIRKLFVTWIIVVGPVDVSEQF
jgi:hypothetical protein